MKCDSYSDFFFRLKYRPHGTNDTLMSSDVYSRSQKVTDLEPGTAYQFRVHSVKNEIESTPTVNVVSTSKIVDFLSEEYV